MNENYESDHSNEQNTGSGFLLAIVLIMILRFLIVSWGWDIPIVQGIFKYEGETAKQWYLRHNIIRNKYTHFRACVEEYDNLDMQTKLDYGGVFYYCE